MTGRSRLLIAGIAFVVSAAVFAMGWFVRGEDSPTDNSGAVGAELTATEADIGFLQDMSDHHGQAVLMSSYLIQHSGDSTMRTMAFNILGSQAYERGQMASMLEDRGAGPGDPNRIAMTWMDQDHWCSLEEMPGMVPSDTLAEFLSSEGPELDRMFAELMLSHHEGGVFMAENAVVLASDPHIVNLARAMIGVQKREITDLQLALG